MFCTLCNNDNLKKYNEYATLPRVTSDTKPFPKGGNLCFCANCGFVQKPLDRKLEKELGEIYSDYTPFFQSKNDTQTVFIGDRKVSRCEEILRRINILCPLNQQGSILDFGCGLGNFLAETHKIAPNASLYAYDLSDKNRKQLQKIPTFQEFYFGDLANINKKFDLVTLVHSLEHIPNPREVLSHIRENLLTENGKIFIQVPNCFISSFDILIADHIGHFTRNSLDYLLESSGFKKFQEDLDWIPKELSFLGEKITSDNVIKNFGDFSFSDTIPNTIQVFHNMLETLESYESFGVFGTAISATWLAGSMEKKIEFFIDEDTSRVGKNYMGKKILSPDQVPSGSVVFLPFHKNLCEILINKHRKNAWDFQLIVPRF